MARWPVSTLLRLSCIHAGAFAANPPVRIDGELQSRLSEADRALGRLDGSIYTLPNPELFVYMYVRKEAVLSSQIEGTQSSLQDLLSAEADVATAEPPRDVKEVVNYVRAMNHGLGRLDALPLSIRLIREIHEELLQEVRGSQMTPGELRRSSELDRAGGVYARTGDVRSAATRRGAKGAIRTRSLPA